VIEHLCAHSAGHLSLEEIQAHATRFLNSDLVVRLAPDGEGRRAPEWSTVAHRALEDRVIGLVNQLAARHQPAIADPANLDVGDGLGANQRDAVGVLCGPGCGVRCVLAPAGSARRPWWPPPPRWPPAPAIRWWGWQLRPRRWPSSTASAWPR